jgi:2'-5' RNA ligase
MTTQYAIVAFPVLEAPNRVESIRRRFDPLASMLKAHVTLVFPFSDAVKEVDLSNHIARAVSGLHPFSILLSEVTVEDDGYLFLNVAAGADWFIELHNRLYTRLLAHHRSPAHEYRPHVTVGRLTEQHQLLFAADETKKALTLPVGGLVNEVALFRRRTATAGDVVGTFSLHPHTASQTSTPP